MPLMSVPRPLVYLKKIHRQQLRIIRRELPTAKSFSRSTITKRRPELRRDTLLRANNLTVPVTDESLQECSEAWHILKALNEKLADPKTDKIKERVNDVLTRPIPTNAGKAEADWIPFLHSGLPKVQLLRRTREFCETEVDEQMPITFFVAAAFRPEEERWKFCVRRTIGSGRLFESSHRCRKYQEANACVTWFHILPETHTENMGSKLHHDETIGCYCEKACIGPNVQRLRPGDGEPTENETSEDFQGCRPGASISKKLPY